METSIVYGGYTGIMEKKMETTVSLSLSLSLSLRLAYGPHPKYSNTGYWHQRKLLQPTCAVQWASFSEIVLNSISPKANAGLADSELRGFLRCRAKACNEILHHLAHSLCPEICSMPAFGDLGL